MTTSQDTSVPTYASVEAAVAAYAAASVGEKTRMRNALSDAISAAVLEQSFDKASLYADMLNAIKAHRATPDGPDYAALASDLAATLEAAAMALRSGVEVDGVGTVRATEPGTPDTDEVARLSTVRARAKRSGNGAVAAFIAANVTDTPRTIAEMLRNAPVDGYRPSSGAIGACLIRVADGTESVEGWTVATIKRDGKKVRGAVAK